MNIQLLFCGILALVSAEYGLGPDFDQEDIPLPQVPLPLIPVTPSLEKCAVTDEDPDADCIKGQAETDYPTLTKIPLDTAFQCPGRGLYADVASRCQLFHVCHKGGRKDTFLCPRGSMFNQQFFTCDYWYNVDCSKSESFFSLNKHLFKIPKTPAPKPQAPEQEILLPGYGFPEPEAPRPYFPKPQAPEPGYEAPEPVAPKPHSPKPHAPVLPPQTPEPVPQEKCLPSAEDPDADCIHGTVDKDYPNYTETPKDLPFVCPNRGLYADVSFRCQIYHICHDDGRKDSFICPKGSIFSQLHFTCDYWYNVDCSKSESLYHLNEQLYKTPKPQLPPSFPTYEAPEPQAPGYLPPTPERRPFETPELTPAPTPSVPKEKCLPTEEDPDADCIHGTVDKDYPNYTEMPKEIPFVCPNRGLYADVSFRCQIYHICHEDGRKDSFICPKGSIFNQQHFTCDYWYNVDCSKSESFYSLNEELYKQPKTQAPAEHIEPCVYQQTPKPKPTHKPYVYTPVEEEPQLGYF